MRNAWSATALPAMMAEAGLPPLPDWAGEAAARYEAGETLRGLARSYHVAPARLSVMLKLSGVSMRQHGPRPHPCPSLASYRRGCRCPGCTAANTAKNGRESKFPPRPPEGSPRRLLADRAVALYATGMSLAQVAAALGYKSQGAAARLVRSAGAQTRTVRPLPPWADAAAEGYEGGASLRELAARYGTGPQVVGRVLVRLGVAVRPARSARPRFPPGRPPAWAAAAAARYAAGATLYSLARRYGTSPRTLRRVLVSKGAVIRPRFARPAPGSDGTPRREP